MQIANIIHLVGATLFMLGGARAHLPRHASAWRGAYDAMRTGYVDETWAKEHHEYWYNDVKAGRIRRRRRAPRRSPTHRTRMQCRATDDQEEEGTMTTLRALAGAALVRGGLRRCGGEAAARRRR